NCSFLHALASETISNSNATDRNTCAPCPVNVSPLISLVDNDAFFVPMRTRAMHCFNPQSGDLCSFGRQIVEAHRAIKKGNGDSRAVRMYAQIAGIVRQFQSKNVLAFLQVPAPERSAVTAAAGYDVSGRMNRHTPRSALKCLFWPQQMFALARCGLEQHHQ